MLPKKKSIRRKVVWADIDYWYLIFYLSQIGGGGTYAAIGARLWSTTILTMKAVIDCIEYL